MKKQKSKPLSRVGRYFVSTHVPEFNINLWDSQPTSSNLQKKPIIEILGSYK